MALFISRPKHRYLTNPSIIHLFSSFSSSPTPPTDQSTTQNPTISQPDQPSSLSSSYFSDVKSSLKQQQKQNPQFQTKPNFSNLRNPPSKPSTLHSFEEIKKNLTEFRRRSSPPPPSTDASVAGPPEQQQQISFQELYNRSMIGKAEDGYRGNNENNTNYKPFSGKLDFEKIRESLKQLRANAGTNTGRRGGDGGSLFSSFKSGLKLRPVGGEDEAVKSSVIGGTRGIGLPGLGKEDMSGKGGGSGTEFVKMYSYGELGEKLRSLRPEVKEGEKGWFSLEELHERLKKLRELEEQETESRVGAATFRDLRESLERLKKSDDEEKAKRSSSKKWILIFCFCL